MWCKWFATRYKDSSALPGYQYSLETVFLVGILLRVAVFCRKFKLVVWIWLRGAQRQMLRFAWVFHWDLSCQKNWTSFLRGKEEFLFLNTSQVVDGESSGREWWCLCVYYKQNLYVIILTNRKSGYNSYLSMPVNQRLVFSCDPCPTVNVFLSTFKGDRMDHCFGKKMHFQLAAVLFFPASNFSVFLTYILKMLFLSCSWWTVFSLSYFYLEKRSVVSSFYRWVVVLKHKQAEKKSIVT